MRLKSEDFAQILNRPGYAITGQAVAPRLSHAIPQRDAGEDSLGTPKAKETGSGRITVRIERRGAKLLDLDNLYGSTKYLCDALRYAGIIPADDPEAIDLIVTQKKVKKEFRGTMVEIETCQKAGGAF